MITEQYTREFKLEFDRILTVMQREWGVKPVVEVQFETQAVALVKFEMKGFAHQGSTFYLNPANIVRRRKPKMLAKEIMKELIYHRETCDRCGTPRPSYYRMKGALGDYNHTWELNEYLKHGRVEDLLVPYDEVDKTVTPGRARSIAVLQDRLRQRLDRERIESDAESLVGLS